MEKEDLDYFKTMLTQKLEQLLSNADSAVSALIDQTDTASDPLDRASIDNDRNYTLRMRDRESRLISKIIQSLKDIEEGTYGYCEVCGEEISVERMKARPVTTYCIQCKTKKESQEKAFGQ